MTSYLDQLIAEVPALQKLSSAGDANGFFAQEALRFVTIAGTLSAIEQFTLDEGASVNERYMTHTLSRSLLENYFWIIYLFDDDAETVRRYEELTNSFKREYVKLLNEPLLPRKTELDPADPLWANLPRGLDVNSMLAQVRNDHGDRLNYLYFVYRVTSFDTHGKNLGTIFETVFGKTCGFPVLKIEKVFELIANQYLVVLNDLRARGVV
tara:strand:+ start:2480 stop:3109 length:630 start_codon:yes stop_codon:yes gene_type:complete